VATIASNGPRGYTPLLGAMRQVFDKYNPRVTERKLITIIATDGVPSDLPSGQKPVKVKDWIDMHASARLPCSLHVLTSLALLTAQVVLSEALKRRRRSGTC
jgi:Mg-chelatase subunit ChlD